MNEFAKWPTSFQRLCSKQRKIIVFLTEINNKTYLKLLVLENVWKVIKTKVQRRIDDIRNAEDLKTVVAEIWTPLQLHYIRSLYDSLPRRLRVVLRLSLGFVGATLKLEYHFPFSTDLSSETHGMGHCPPGICRGL
jgi:hypothetical protein